VLSKTTCWSDGWPIYDLAMPRRTRYDPLQRLQQPTWLVVRNKHRQPLEWRQLAPGADLRAMLLAARTERIAAGWVCTEVGRHESVFMAERDGERLETGIERYDPAGPEHPGHSVPSAEAVRGESLE
jgi:hypothetical protein